ncbi:protein translocase subunit SecA [Acidaminococcus sp. CAG:917]|nr:protein translocase subunit SecA [Acidaminococcus sp. CAG:917]
MGLFKGENFRHVKKLKKTADKIELLADSYAQLTNEQLQAKTEEFKKRISDGEKLESILPEAYATVREAATRVLGMRHFYVQLLGGIALHQGRIAEMATGEGKTLVATLPAYLNALTGKGVHVVTVNDYLATRDAYWMGKLYKFLGLSVGIVVPQMKVEDKRAAYSADITYCTNNELGFDFLRDNMVVRKKDKVQRELNFAIIDEVDSILIDEARTPLIISGRGGKSSDMYKMANSFARTLKEGDDFTIDEKEKAVSLTDDGITKAEKYFKVSNLSDIENTELYHHIQQALKAHNMMKRDRDYIVSDGEVLIVDEFTGRVMVGRRYSEGLHQAIEAKEGVPIRSENKTLATITFQNFFRMYSKLSGMTGTAKTEEDEFKGIYSLDVVTIPPNKPSMRVDEHDQIYTTVNGKMKAIIADIEKCYESGQPVLVGTVSVEKSEELSKQLRRLGINHNVLNAKMHKKEAEIIAQAGRYKAVTIATNMAGRGTDIQLGGNPEYQAKQKLEKDGYDPETIEAAASILPSDDEKVLKARQEYNRHYEAFKKICEQEKEQVIALGGLRIIGTERHESRRIDNQLRGRAGRQGDKGSTVFYISMEDDVARIFGGDKMKQIAELFRMDEDDAISSGIVTKQIERAQLMVESRNFSIRKQVLSYDDVMNAQREIIYKERGKVLDGLDVHDQILDMIDSLAEHVIETHADYKQDYKTWDYEAFNNALEQKMIPKGSNVITEKLASHYDVYKMKDAVLKIALKNYEDKIAKAKEQGIDWGEIERIILLKTVDAKWMDHIDQMDALRRGIGLRALGQRDPVLSYRQEGWNMFDDMIERIHGETASILLKIEVVKNEEGKEKMSVDKSSQKVAVKNAESKKAEVGRNDPCPCGSGKKYKNCCGKNL